MHVAPHAAVRPRRHATSRSRCPITFAEAALGADVEVPTLDGDPVTLRVPPGTQTGTTVPGQGPGHRAGQGRPGDLLVTVEVAVPATLDRRASARRVEALAAATTESPRAAPGGCDREEVDR